MSTLELRRQAKRTIDQLSGPSLRFVTEFLLYLQQRQPDEATAELLKIPGFLPSFARGAKDVRSGRVKSWRKVRRDV